MTALICGSFAYDTIMTFPDRFRNHILAERVDVISVCFTVPGMRREFGGCAGNVAYNLKLLGGDPLPMAAVGRDFAPYAEWMDETGIERRHLTEVDAFTAQAFITTDEDGNQITAFHPGAMEHAHVNSVRDAVAAAGGDDGDGGGGADDAGDDNGGDGRDSGTAGGRGGGIGIGIVSPDGREAMVRHAREFAEIGIPFVFDPGQALPMFGPQDLDRFLGQAAWLAVNAYEWELFRQRSGLGPDDIVRRVRAVVVTRGAQGSTVLQHGRAALDIPPAAAPDAVDPTGCGDAYRAGLLLGLQAGYDWETTGRLASLAGAVKVACHGCQNHRIDPPEFAARFRTEFGYSF